MLWLTEGLALDDAHFSAIKHLGQINGVALHCKALAETQRIKRALVLNLPKRRQLGDLFDVETNASFLRFIEEGGTCPNPDLLRKQVDEAILQLEATFNKQ
jgi:hypothetical protein